VEEALNGRKAGHLNMNPLDKFEIRNSKFEGFVSAIPGRIRIAASVRNSGFEFRASNFEFS